MSHAGLRLRGEALLKDSLRGGDLGMLLALYHLHPTF